MPRLGIIAGGGGLPVRLVEACRREQRDFFVLGFKGQTDADFLSGVPHEWSRLGATDAAIQILKKNGCDTVVMAGAIRRPSLAEMRPDWRTVKVFAKLGARAFGDDVLLRAVAGELEKDGLKIVGVHEVDPDLVTPSGVLGKTRPTPEHLADVEMGIRAARILGQLDVGQAAIVQQGIVLGLEAVEGTDALIDRCRMLRRKGRGGVLVKACKPQQDRRLDLPTIGMRTIRKAAEAGLEGIAVEAGASIVLDRETVVAAADGLNMFITGFQS